MTKFLRTLLVLVLLPISAAGLAITATAPAQAVGTVSSTTDAVDGFPAWYQDSAGNRVEQCLDPNDPNCVVLPGPTFDPTAPLAFPSNFPDEFFYALADSEIVDTPGCLGTPPGRASVRLALEGAFINGTPAAADRMVFGRIRVKVTSGLCPQTTYQFRHPFGTETFTTNDAGAVPANAGTEDIGCVPVPGVPCNFGLAGGSRIFGTAGAGGFLRWDPAVAPAAPAGYLGDGATLHEVTGGTHGNAFQILDSSGTPTGMGTALFAVAGKLAGPLLASPNPADFGGQDLGTASAPKTVTITNVDSAAVTLGTPEVQGAAAAEFGLAGGTCAAGTALARDASCTVQVTFAPTGLAGRRTAALVVPSTGGTRSPLTVTLTGAGKNVGDAPVVSLSSTALDFGNVRVRETSPLRHVVVTNTGAAPLAVTDVRFDPATTPEPDHYRILGDTCSTGLTVDPGGSCAVDVEFAPFVAGPHPSRILLSSNTNTGLDTVSVTGTGTGGVAAVSPTTDPANGFPDWYMDEAGVKVSQCLDPADPNCIVLADPFYDPAQPLAFPTNFPSEFFYQVATSDNISVTDCDTGTAGRAFMRSAVEGTFANAAPVDGDQMVFGRIRFSVTGGLCPDTEYVFTSPYGADHFVTDSSGGLKRVAGTQDVGCVPVPGTPCDFTVALSSRVLGGLVRWDPAVAPAAPAGYLGDGATLHAITGAPYAPDGVNPANYFRITRADDGTVIGETDQFTVMGKLRGPLESDVATVDFGAVAQGSTSPTTSVTLTNTGIAALTVNSLTVAGADAADFVVDPGTCAGVVLAPGGNCTASAQFSPSANGTRTARIEVSHTGLNNPLVIGLRGVGGAVGATASISFSPRGVAFGGLHVGRVSEVETVTVSNIGGNLPLTVLDATVGGANPGQFAVVDNRCLDEVPPGAVCQIDVVFSPTANGAALATLALTDNAPGGSHSVALSGTGVAAERAVSAGVDSRNGFPSWYQDGNGTRLEGCLDPASGRCVLLGDATYNPANALLFPSNFPGEFFYALADSQLVTTPGCPAFGVGQGTAMLRLALEGSFANGTPVNGDQITFGRVRIIADGLCPGTPYTFLTPYGPVQRTTDAAGSIKPRAGTVDVGGGALDFAAALATDVAHSFPRWNPNAGAAAPTGHLGDAVSYHSIVGGTYVPAGGNGAVNAFAIADSAGNELGRTDQFLVSGKVAGPLQADRYAVDFGHVPAGTTSGQRTVTVTNVGPDTTLGEVSLAGANAAEFQVTGGTCATGAPLASDASCTVTARFAPVTAGTKSAQLRVAASGSPALVVALTGLADPPLAPTASVTPGVLAFGTRTAGTTTTLTTTVSNTGNANLVVGAPTVSGSAAGDYSVVSNTCTAAVVPGASCVVGIAFSPRATGLRTASLTIPHNATGGSTVVSLTGSGVASTFSLSPSPVKFGTVTRNTTKSQTVSVKNSGTLAFTPTSASITGTQAAAFTVTGPGCLGVVLAAGRSCTITVSFRPTLATNYSATLVVRGDSTTLPQTVSAGLTGTGK